jgi:oligosaccharide translocation protein RFT1
MEEFRESAEGSLLREQHDIAKPEGVSLAPVHNAQLLCRFSLKLYSKRTSGIYGEVQNLGSLVVRMVFWPIENAAFRAFSEAPIATSRGGQAASTQASQSHSKTAAHAHANLEHAHIPRILLLLRIVVLCASLACTFGPNYSFAAIHVLLSHTWSSTTAPTVLAAYCGYLLCLAVNGVCEAYVHATMTAGDLMRSNVAMVSIVLVQAGCIAASHRVGESCLALVAIDCASMIARITVACFYIRKWHKHYKGSWFKWLPASGSLLALAVAALVTNASNRVMLANLSDEQLSQRLPAPMLNHIAVGGGVLCCVLLCWFRTERGLYNEARNIMNRHQD